MMLPSRAFIAPSATTRMDNAALGSAAGMVEPMPFFITRVVSILTVSDRATPRVMTTGDRSFTTCAEADAAARERYAGQECHIVEANNAGDALRKILPGLDASREQLRTVLAPLSEASPLP
jgi:hypothetical protein